MTFTNISDEDAYAIFQNYQKANGGFGEKTGERDYVVLSAGLYTGQMAGVYSDLRYVMAEKLTLDRLKATATQSRPKSPAFFRGDPRCPLFCGYLTAQTAFNTQKDIQVHGPLLGSSEQSYAYASTPEAESSWVDTKRK